LRSMFSPVHRSEDRAGRHVFFPEGRTSCLPRRKLRMSLRNFRRVLDVTYCPWCCMGRRARLWERVGRVKDAEGCCFPLLLRLAFIVSLGWLGGCLSFRIGIWSVSAFGLFCVAPVVIAGFSPGRCCAALVCCILCVCWDRIPRAC